MKQKYTQDMLDAMSRNPSNWRGVFYINRKDPRLIVPKINPSLGQTFNFASPWAYLTIIGIILVIVIVKHFGLG